MNSLSVQQVPANVVLTRETKLALEWFYHLSETEKYEEYKNYCKRHPLGTFYTFEYFCISMSRIHEQWDFRGRKLI